MANLIAESITDHVSEYDGVLASPKSFVEFREIGGVAQNPLEIHFPRQDNGSQIAQKVDSGPEFGVPRQETQEIGKGLTIGKAVVDGDDAVRVPVDM
ncbi:MAG: hypothetical protein MI741_13660 [Rhodospirillales bacterium]|nr:hypothetical protein [Rhodospirillales bacterium]